eukprot:766395-Hanusia_phi.AAC.6
MATSSFSSSSPPCFALPPNATISVTPNVNSTLISVHHPLVWSTSLPRFHSATEQLNFNPEILDNVWQLALRQVLVIANTSSVASRQVEPRGGPSLSSRTQRHSWTQ